MSELCLSNTSQSQFPSLLLSDFLLFCSFILSHPLYFSYFIFFSPYLFKLLSFLSPLFITTSLLLLALFTVSPGFLHGDSATKFSESGVGFLLSKCYTIIERLQSKIDDKNDDFCNFEEFEVYRIVFDTSSFDHRENPVEVSDLIKWEEKFCLDASEPHVPKCSTHEVSGMNTYVGENPGDEVVVMETSTKNIGHVMEEKSFFKELDSFENMADCNVEEKKVDEPPCTKPNKVVGELEKKESVVRSGSEATTNIKISFDNTVKMGTDDIGREHISKLIASPCFNTLGANVYNGDYTLNVGSSRRLDSNLGSMRKEKEWKRTLACKLFEERHNVDGEEGMDSLWETYETDNSSKAATGKSDMKKKNKKKGGIYEKFYDQEEEDDDEEEELANGQLCCLQALKFSAGKMNLGMGRPNLVRISKALKGLGWLHHVSRHGKKR